MKQNFPVDLTENKRMIDKLVSDWTQTEDFQILSLKH